MARIYWGLHHDTALRGDDWMTLGRLGASGGGFGRASLAGVPMPSPGGFDVLRGADGAYLLGSDGAFLYSPRISVTVKSAIVSVDLTTLGATIPANFVGFSTEADDFTAGYYQGTTGAMASYIGVASLLGSSGIFRIGGSSSNTPVTPAFNQANATALASFASGLGAGWTVMYGLDLKAADSATAATQAGYLDTALGAKLVLQMANEPFTGGDFTTVTYPTAWNAYYSAITAAVPGAKFAAADDNNQGSSQTAIAGLTPGLAGLTYVTIHNYTVNGTSTDWPTLLAQMPTDAFLSIIYPYAHAGSIPLIMSECNSINNGGAAGLSDRMMSQTWFLRMAIHLTKIGWAGMCIHGTFDSQPGIYNPIVRNANGNFSPHPVFYGMYLFSRIAGKQIAASTQGGTANIDSIAVKEVSGNASVIVSNNEAVSPAYIKPMQSAAWTTATVLLSRDSDGGGPTASAMTLGGQAIGEGGTWSGTTFTINNGDSVAIPPCGAALIKFQT